MRKKGFTLVELLVVVAIISLFLSMTVAIFREAKAKTRDAKRLKDMEQVQLAVALYNDDNDSYPVCPEVVINGINDCFSNEMSPGNYLSTIPIDPSGGSAGDCDGEDDFVYCYYSENGNNYTLKYRMETGSLQSEGWHSTGL